MKLVNTSEFSIRTNTGVCVKIELYEVRLLISNSNVIMGQNILLYVH